MSYTVTFDQFNDELKKIIKKYTDFNGNLYVNQ